MGSQERPALACYLVGREKDWSFDIEFSTGWAAGTRSKRVDKSRGTVGPLQNDPSGSCGPTEKDENSPQEFLVAKGLEIQAPLQKEETWVYR